jgi:LCP family protein required for cell wall assembly
MYFNKKENEERTKKKFYQKKWFKITASLIFIILVVGGVFMWKTGGVLHKISKGSIFGSIVHSLPGIKQELKGESDGQINIAVLGMRGENVPGGGTLADTIIIVSIRPTDNKIAMISIPRDLYVSDPDTQSKEKINAVNAYGEEKGKGQGLENMKKVLSDVTGLPIQYAASINFAGFTQLVNAVGGVDVNLPEAFSEPMQFQEERVCDGYVFTKPTGKFEYKYHTGLNGIKRVVKTYPLCTNPNTECGGDFKLPAGKQTLNGDQALCFVRSRKTSSDFERAKRQQIVIQNIKDKMMSAGTLTDFEKINGILNSLGDNVRSDLELWEMKRFHDIYAGMQNPQIFQRVLENSEEGLLYNPTNFDKAAGYILLPLGDNYDRIHAMAKDIFSLPPQTDITPK